MNTAASMRVLQVLPELNEGGVERGTVELSRELVGRGIDTSSAPAASSSSRRNARLKLPVRLDRYRLAQSEPMSEQIQKVAETLLGEPLYRFSDWPNPEVLDSMPYGKRMSLSGREPPVVLSEVASKGM
jgi:hypothetical protein